MIQIKRIYEKPASTDGTRILVDRLWPRGVSKQNAQLDAWLKDIAPSPELRKWFRHDPQKFAEFSAKYQTELDNNPAMTEMKHLLADNKIVTLLYGAKDPAVNHAVVLQKFLEDQA